MSVLESNWQAQVGPLAQCRRVYRGIRVILHLAAGLGTAVFLGAFQRPRRAVVRRAVRYWLLTAVSILNVRVKVTGAPVRGPAIVVSNHVSWLDIPVLGAREEFMFVAHDKVRHWPVLGPLAAAAGTIFLRRGRREAEYRRDEIAHYLRRGRKVLVFPEGTTTNGQGVAPFHGRLLAAAAQAGVPVQPVTVRYARATGERDAGVPFVGDDDFVRHMSRLLLRRRLFAHVIFHEPVQARPGAPDELARAARASVAGAL